jgi:hypothetical protein
MFHEGEGFAFANNEMVKYHDIDQIQRLLQVLCKAVIVRTRLCKA